MDRCKDCQHWEAPEAGKEHGWCSSLNATYEAGDKTAFFGVAGGYMLGEVMTGPDFGCIHWQSR
jgi:hypothetical protein